MAHLHINTLSWFNQRYNISFVLIFYGEFPSQNPGPLKVNILHPLNPNLPSNISQSSNNLQSQSTKISKPPIKVIAHPSKPADHRPSQHPSRFTSRANVSPANTRRAGDQAFTSARSLRDKESRGQKAARPNYTPAANPPRGREGKNGGTRFTGGRIIIRIAQWGLSRPRPASLNT